MLSPFWLAAFCIFVFIIGVSLGSSTEPDENFNDPYTYDDDDETIAFEEDYQGEGNDTDTDYFSFTGRNEVIYGDHRPANNDHLHELTTLLNLHRPLHRPLRPGLHHKRKKLVKHAHYKRLLPLLLAALAKVAHLLPVVKLTLLALFGLVLFSKKALLVSLGSLILVLYDTFYKGKVTNNVGVSIVKDRGSAAPTLPDHVHPEEGSVHSSHEHPWLAREEVVPPKLQLREDIADKKRRWWAPQINHRRKPAHSAPTEDSQPEEITGRQLLLENLEDFVYNY